ncbi:MAG: phosphoribosyl-ATP diphosphatase [Qipengyuania sp.]
MDTLFRLEQTIRERREVDPGSSYVAQLRSRGPEVMARKFGEEALETVIAALAGSRQEMVGEAADTLFHLIVLLAEKGVTLEEVIRELDRRSGVSGLEEKANRSS